MSLICDEDGEDSFENDQITEDYQRLEKRSISTEEIFRGFAKVPLVLCQRIDITPYLDKLKQTEPPDLEECTKPASSPFKAEEMAKIFNNCTVNLVREDLHRLKDMLRQARENLKCKICDKEYHSVRKLNNHLENKHMIIKTPKRVSFSEHIVVHEVKEYHRCRKCPKIFKDYNNLKLHMRHNHKKRKCYICHYCNKDFVDRTFFKVHIKTHCDACGLLLPNKKLYLEHRERVCRIARKYECRTCVRSFFHFMDLKDHSYDHLGTFFICDICKDLFHNKCAIAHHIQFSHSKVRPTSSYTKSVDNVFTCNFCEDSCNVLEDMEKHVSDLPDLQDRVTTDYEDYHFCDQCYRKFDTETDMLQHKWSHYLTSVDNSQTREADGDIPGTPEEPEGKCDKIRTTYKVTDDLPEFLQPKLILKRIELPKRARMKNVLNRPESFIDVTNLTVGQLKKPIIDPVTKKTIISKHKCEKCGKYLSSNYCLTRHIREVHGIGKGGSNDENLRCCVCEEVFFWPYLLQNHRCIGSNVPEMPFNNARPEIYYDGMEDGHQSHDHHSLGHDSEEDFMNVDYEIASPIVQLTEYDNLNIVVNHGNGQLDVIDNEKSQVNGIGFKVVMQEVPIEF